MAASGSAVTTVQKVLDEREVSIGEGLASHSERPVQVRVPRRDLVRLIDGSHKM